MASAGKEIPEIPLSFFPVHPAGFFEHPDNSVSASGVGCAPWGREEGKPISLCLAPAEFAKPAFVERAPAPCIHS